MEAHPHFDLRLHSDAELAGFIGVPIIARVTLHQWPLSCVQRITGADGISRIYRAQAGPTVEHRFYAAARSPLLPWAERLYAQDGYVCLLLEDLQGSQLNPDMLSEAAALRLGTELLAQIAAIEGDLPAYQKLDGVDWETTACDLLAKIALLRTRGTFAEIDDGAVAAIARACENSDLLDQIGGEIGTVHGDLTPDNLIFMPNGHKLIDWQFVRRGPRLIDLAIFLESLGVDPLPHVGGGIVRLTALMRIHWLVECATTWFPPGAPTYAREIMRLADGLGELSV